MEKPYVPVAKGGMWNTSSHAVSDDTKKLLNIMMNESKLTNFQQRALNNSISSGRSLPNQCHPTSGPYQQKQHIRSKKPPSISSIRTKESCMANGAYEREKYKPGPTVDRDLEKERFVNKLAFGKEDLSKPKPKKRPPSPEKRDIDRFDELWKEIEDRKEFLFQMESLGQGKQYRNAIITEISQKIREMEVIDKKRSKELNDALEKQGLT